MSLYAIGDLHLHYQSQLRAPGQLTEKVWKNHEERFRKNCALIRDSDTLVLVGDHSWGRNLDECEKDLQYIINLPGRKVLLRGNHDMFWDAKKTAALNARFEGRLFFLQNNYFPYRDYALVGTKGYTFEGPFYLNGAGRSLAGMRRKRSTRRNWWSESWNACGHPLRQLVMTATPVSSCSSTTRPRTSWNDAMASRIWQRNTARNRWSTPIATARAASTIA